MISFGCHFLDAANLSKNNEKNVTGIVINTFSEPFVVPKEMFEVIAVMYSSFDQEALVHDILINCTFLKSHGIIQTRQSEGLLYEIHA